MADKGRFYYEARSFSIYYFANAVSNVVSNPGSYLRGIDEIIGDMQALMLMRPFNRFTNLHHFLDGVVRHILGEEIRDLPGEQARFMEKFLNVYSVPHAEADLADEEAFYDFAAQSECYQDSVDALVDEIFHVLFHDVRFLEAFNQLCAEYIESSGLKNEQTSANSKLKRVPIPMWSRRAIFHRDKGECRQCKRSLTAIVSQIETERYDHIIPLARFGSNDVTNLQLLCEPCNLRKAAKLLPVSPLYPRVIV